jgi:hypothetical protein
MAMGAPPVGLAKAGWCSLGTTTDLLVPDAVHCNRSP